MYGRNWKVKFEVKPFQSNSDYAKLLFVITTINKDGQRTDNPSNFLINIKNPEKTTAYFLPRDMVIITWHDRRTVREIKKSVLKYNQMIELTENKIIPISKITND